MALKKREWCVSGRQADKAEKKPPDVPPPAIAATVRSTPTPRSICRTEARIVNDDINVLALVKGKERYIFLYDDGQRAQALRALGRHASNPELSFTWYDAAVLSQKIRQEARQHSTNRFGIQVSDSEEWS